MLSMQHIMTAMIDGHTTDEKEYMAGVVFPDAIRAFTGDRELSHFEENPKTGEISWMQFPDHMNVTKDEVSAWMIDHSKLADNIEKGPLGQQTHLEMFKETNSALEKENPEMYQGIMDHLKQDIVYDKYVRDYIGPDRDTIFKDEDHAMYVAAHKIYEEQGILCNREWFENTVKPILEEKMPDLAENTFKYMHFSDPQYEKWVEEADWSHVNEGPELEVEGINVKFSEYDYNTLYENAINLMDNFLDEKIFTLNIPHGEAVRIGAANTLDSIDFSRLTPENCKENFFDMETGHLEVPEGIRDIEMRAFKENELIKSVTLPSTISYIAADAFNGCTNLERVEIKNPKNTLSGRGDISVIGDRAFKNCTSLKDLTLPNNMDYIENYALEGCTSLKSVDLPDNVILLDGAFSGCTSLSDLQTSETFFENMPPKMIASAFENTGIDVDQMVEMSEAYRDKDQDINDSVEDEDFDPAD